MRFMLLMMPKGYERAVPGAMPDAQAVAAMMKFNESMQNAGVLLSLDGLHPPSMGARVSFAAGRPVVSNGPFPEAKQVLGGYWMLQVKSKQEAVEWALRSPCFRQRSDRGSAGSGVLGLSARCPRGDRLVSRTADPVRGTTRRRETLVAACARALPNPCPPAHTGRARERFRGAHAGPLDCFQILRTAAET